MESSNLILPIVIAYLVVIVGIIIWTGSKAQKTYRAFALGDGSIPWPVVAGTMFASTVGGGTMIGYVGSYKASGFQWSWVPLMQLVAYCIAGAYFAPRLRKLGQVTTGDMLGIRYGRTSKLIASGLTCLGEVACVVSMTSSFATMVHGYLGMDYQASLIAAVVVFYFSATLGGLKGVAWTDAIQALVIFITVSIVTVLSVAKLNTMGGFAAVKPNLIDPFAENINWLTMSGYMLSLALMVVSMQSIFIQRINASRSPEDAKKATIFTGVACASFMVLGVGVIGVAATVITPDDVTGNNVVTAVLADMNPAVGALYAAAIIAAVLTTANSMLLSASLCFVRDFCCAANPSLVNDDKKQLLYSKLFMVAVCIGAVLVVNVAPGIMLWILMIYTIIGSMAFPLYYGLMSRKATPLSGTLGLALGGGISIIWEALNMFKMRPEALKDVHAMWLGLAFGIAGCMIGRLSSKKSSPEQLAVVDAFTKQISLEEAAALRTGD